MRTLSRSPQELLVHDVLAFVHIREAEVSKECGERLALGRLHLKPHEYTEATGGLPPHYTGVETSTHMLSGKYNCLCGTWQGKKRGGEGAMLLGYVPQIKNDGQR